MHDVSTKERELIHEIANQFNWVSDEEKQGYYEHWKIYKELPFTGDCDDFALTCLYFLEEKSKVSFYRALFTHKAKIVLCRIDNENHVVLKYKELYIDQGNCFVSLEELLEQGYEIHEKSLFKSYQVFAMIMLSKGYTLLPKKIKSNRLLRLYQRSNIISIQGLSILGWYQTFNDFKIIWPDKRILRFAITFIIHIAAWLFTISVPIFFIWIICLAYSTI